MHARVGGSPGLGINPAVSSSFRHERHHRRGPRGAFCGGGPHSTHSQAAARRGAVCRGRGAGPPDARHTSPIEGHVAGTVLHVTGGSRQQPPCLAPEGSIVNAISIVLSWFLTPPPVCTPFKVFSRFGFWCLDQVGVLFSQMANTQVSHPTSGQRMNPSHELLGSLLIWFFSYYFYCYFWGTGNRDLF